MTEKEIGTIRLVPDGFYISEQFYPIAPGADFEQRLEETMLDANISHLGETAECVRCIVETNRFSLSPISESEEHALSLFKLMSIEETHDEVMLHTYNEPLKVRFTYALPAATYHFLRRTLPDVEFELDANLVLSESHPEQGLLVKVSKQALTLVAFIDGQLQLCNRINDQGSDNNRSYFIMSTWAQLGLNPLTDVLQLVDADDKLRQNLRTYIKCVL